MRVSPPSTAGSSTAFAVRGVREMAQEKEVRRLFAGFQYN
jgi:hypothetical protein